MFIIISSTLLSRPGWLVLGASSVLLSGTLLYLMVSRRGETKAVTKCAVLSVWAHFILIGLAYLTSWLPAPVGIPGPNHEVKVRWVDDPLADAIVETSDRTLLPDATADPPDVTPRMASHGLLNDPASVGEIPIPPANGILDEEPPAVVDEVAPRQVLPDQHLVSRETDSGPEVSEKSDEEAPIESSVSNGHAATDDAPSEATPADMHRSDSVDAERLSDRGSDDQTMAEAETLIDEDEAAFLLAETETRSDDLSSDHVRPPAAPPEGESNFTSNDAMQPGNEPRQLATQGTPGERQELPARYAGRTQDHRLQLALARGGSLDTEASVDSALAWLAKAQNQADGRWETTRWQGGQETRELSNAAGTIQADTAITGLALLAFLGAGHTHQQGEYRDTVRRGIEFLRSQQSPVNGSLAGNASPYVAMYCHGIASLALSEALVMTADTQLQPVVKRAVEYTLAAQHPATGGWRYRPGDRGDTSQFGWQLMVLVSAQAAEIRIPPSAFAGAERWLKRVSLGEFGGLACYTPERRVPSGSMTAEAMVCRTFVSQPATTRTTDEAANFILREAQDSDRVRDLYFTYYATLALYPLQDERWEAWNTRLKRSLLPAQHATGHLAGSWDPTTKWGPTGGRVYSTSLACLCLETYYRYLPVYELAVHRGESIRRR